MIETGMCTYRTPCGWCSKWDKDRSGYTDKDKHKSV